MSAAARFSLDDYVDVAERIVVFKEAHPEGSLQTISWEVREVAGKTFVVYRAAAYRTANDRRPGQGIAWEPFPGTTPYTKNSELMNAETAAWGRAIVALGHAANRKLASRQEVRARVAEGEAEKAQAAPDPITEDTLALLRGAYAERRPSDDEFRKLLAEVGVEGAADGDLATLMAGVSESQAGWLVVALSEQEAAAA